MDQSQSLLLRRRGVLLGSVIALLVAVVLGGCGGASTPTTTVTPAAPVTQAGPLAYASTTFVVPFDITLADWIRGKPSVEEPNFITWETPDAPPVRFLVPVTVYPPGQKGAKPPPEDYLEYLLGQTKHGAVFTDQTETTLGGLPATLLTGTTDHSLDGSLGCPTAQTAAPECFGLQPDLALRIAVVKVQDKTLLVWLRLEENVDASERTSKIKSFEDMLGSIHFSDRPVQPPATPTSQPTPSSSSTTTSQAVTAIDGVWTARWTYEELVRSPLLIDQGEVNDENWGLATLTLKRGKASESMKNQRASTSSTATYSLSGNIVTFRNDNGEVFVMRWSLKGDQLRFTRDDTLGVGPTPFVIKPFTRKS